MIVQRLSSTRKADPVWPWMLLFVSISCLFMKAAYLVLAPDQASAWLRLWGFVPSEVMQVLAVSPFAGWLDFRVLGLVTALFVHADWLHLAGNLAYLWVFGITVERAVGHWRFIFLFILLGVTANLSLAWQAADSATPVIGASGGVSAIIGLYLGMFPGRRMGLWVPLGLYLQFARVPALLVIGSWFTLQLLYSIVGPTSGAVAWWAHLAGFLAGLVAAMCLRLIPGSINYSFQDD